MDILVLSDTHGARRAILGVLEQINFRPVAILFLGDCVRDLEVLDDDERYRDIPRYAVAGNCDASIVFPTLEPTERTLCLGGCRIVMMHGHTRGVKSSLVSALYYASEQEADVLLYGHTHVPDERTIGAEQTRCGKSILVANPGSLGQPRDGSRPSFGVLTVRDGKALFSHGTLK